MRLSNRMNFSTSSKCSVRAERSGVENRSPIMLEALKTWLGMLCGFIVILAAESCGSEKEEEEALDIQLTSKPAKVETFKEAEFVFTLLEDGKPEGGHAANVKVEATTDVHATPKRDSGMSTETTTESGMMSAPEIAEGQHKVHMTFLTEGNYHVELMTDHHGEEVEKGFDVTVEDASKESAGHKVKFEIEPAMGMHSGDVHIGDKAEFEFVVTEGADNKTVSDLTPSITFTSPNGSVDAAAEAENKGSGTYKAERAFASGETGNWKAKFAATEGDEIIEVEFEFPVSETHSGDRMPVMEMHSSSMMSGMKMGAGR